MLHTSFYTSQDYPVTGTWSVYTEQYVHADEDCPIDGTQRLVESGFPTEQAADARAAELYREAHPEPTVQERLEYLRGEIKAERMSYGDLAELQSLATHIEEGDLDLMEPAGVPEWLAMRWNDFTQDEKQLIIEQGWDSDRMDTIEHLYIPANGPRIDFMRLFIDGDLDDVWDVEDDGDYHRMMRNSTDVVSIQVNGDGTALVIVHNRDDVAWTGTITLP